MKKAVFILALLLVSPVSAYFWELGSEKVYLYWDFASNSSDANFKSWKGIMERCLDIEDQRDEGWDGCYSDCDWTPDNPSVFYGCVESCRDDVAAEASDLLKAEFENGALLLQNYYVGMLEQLLPPSKLEDALPELDQVFSDILACVAPLEIRLMHCIMPKEEEPNLPLLGVYEVGGGSIRCGVPDLLKDFEEKYAPFQIGEGMTLAEWKTLIREKTGASRASRTITDCENAIKQQEQSCSKNEGWMVDDAMEIVSATDEHFEYQDVAATGGCPQGGSPRTTVDTRFFDSLAGDYQVLCSINCYTWDCDDPLRSDKGTGEVLRDGAWQPFTGDVQVGDVVRTGEDSRQTIAIGGSLVKLGSNSNIEMGENSIFLKSGEVWASIQSPDAMIFATPTATHTITGTEFILEYDEGTNVSTLYLFEGEIDLTATIGTSTQVVAGEKAVTEESGKITTTKLSDRAWNAKVEETLGADAKINYVALAYGAAALVVLVSLLYIILSKHKRCPLCKAPLPKARIPKNLKQAIRFSVTCKCGKEVSMSGKKVFKR